MTAATVCAEEGCWRPATRRGRCPTHQRKRDPNRMDGRTIQRTRRLLQMRDGPRCQHPNGSLLSCHGPLEIHHRDGNPANNRLDNLELQCTGHHDRGGHLAGPR
jgi:HNH endonuclease